MYIFIVMWYIFIPIKILKTVSHRRRAGVNLVIIEIIVSICLKFVSLFFSFYIYFYFVFSLLFSKQRRYYMLHGLTGWIIASMNPQLLYWYKRLVNVYPLFSDRSDGCDLEWHQKQNMSWYTLDIIWALGISPPLYIITNIFTVPYRSVASVYHLFDLISVFGLDRFFPLCSISFRLLRFRGSFSVIFWLVCLDRHRMWFSYTQHWHSIYFP